MAGKTVTTTPSVSYWPKQDGPPPAATEVKPKQTQTPPKKVKP